MRPFLLHLAVLLGVSAAVPSGSAANSYPPPTQALAQTSIIKLDLRFIDATTQQAIAVRAGVFDSLGNARPPMGLQPLVYQGFGWRSFFYTDSIATVFVDPGPTTIRTGKGFEYGTRDSTLTITGDTLVTIALERLIDMKSYGWYSGETHMHLTHEPAIYTLDATHLKKIAHAEDLNIVNSMEDDQAFFSGDVHPLSTPEHILYFSKEQRNPHFGHMTVLGLKQWVPPDFGCIETGFACGRTLNGILYEQYHAQGPDLAVIAAHPLSTIDLEDWFPWPGGGVWRGMPMDLIAGHVDAIDLLSYSNVALDPVLEAYYHALNAGFRLPPSAGSDAAVGRGNTQPPGGYRVYAMPPDGSGFTFSNWTLGLRAGRTFVSNYPLFTEFTIDGSMSGDVVTHSGQPLQGTVTVWCQLPMDTLEIVANGGVLHRFFPDPDSLSFTANFAVDPTQVTWVAARVCGDAGYWHSIPADGLFAHTAPIYFEAGVAQAHNTIGVDQACIDAGNYFLGMLGSVQQMFDNHGIFPDNSQAAFDSAMAGATYYYGALHQEPPTAFDLINPCGDSLVTVASTTPNFSWESSSDPDPGDSVSYELSIDVSPTFSAPLTITGIQETNYRLTSGDSLQSGQLYYWKLLARDTAGNTQSAIPPVCSLYVATTVTGVGNADPPPANWWLGEPRPNPFGSSVRIAYRVPPGAGNAGVAVFDAAGRLIRRLRAAGGGGSGDGGEYEATWDGRDAGGRRVASGVYFMRLQPASGPSLTRKVVIVR
jgi:hypothetical protein